MPTSAPTRAPSLFREHIIAVVWRRLMKQTCLQHAGSSRLKPHLQDSSLCSTISPQRGLSIQQTKMMNCDSSLLQQSCASQMFAYCLKSLLEATCQVHVKVAHCHQMQCGTRALHTRFLQRFLLTQLNMWTTLKILACIPIWRSMVSPSCSHQSLPQLNVHRHMSAHSISAGICTGGRNLAF